MMPHSVGLGRDATPDASRRRDRASPARRATALAVGLIAAGLFGSVAASAQALWVGEWFEVPNASRHSAHNFTIKALSGGRLRYDASEGPLVLSPGGAPVPAPGRPYAVVSTRALTPRSFRYVETVDALPYERVEARLSDDGRKLSRHVTIVGTGGAERSYDTIALRVGGGTGLAGTWREPPRPAAPRSAAPTKPYWIIAQDETGVADWSIPSTGEVLRGRTDGRSYPVAGPFAEPGVRFVLTVLSPRHLRWSFLGHGRLAGLADDTLSADGAVWTDLQWSPAHPLERDRYVYRRAPRPAALSDLGHSRPGTTRRSLMPTASCPDPASI